MQENITTSIPASPRAIQQSDIEQDYNFLQAQRVTENMLKLGLISLSEFNKLSLKIGKHSLRFGWRLCPKSVDI